MNTKIKLKPFLLSNIVGLFLLNFLFLNAFSVERDKALVFSDSDGLPRNIVTCIEQDKYGYTWIGTRNGIARFDGNTFYSYSSLKGVNINYLLVDELNRLWASSAEGLYYYNRLTDEFELKREGYNQKIIVRDKNVFVAGGDRILNVNDTVVSVVLEAPDLWDFCFDNNGVWVSNGNNGVRFFEENNYVGSPSKSFLNGRQVSLIRKIDDKMFFACRNGQIYVLTNTKKLSKVAIHGYSSVMEIIKVDGQIWLATDGDGIIILDKNGNYIKSIQKTSNQSSKINSNSIYDIYLGSNNEVWVGTYSGGLICLQKDVSPFKNIIPEARNRNSLVDKEGTAIFVHNNKIYFGTNYGLSIFNENNDRFSNFGMERIKNDLKDEKVLAINIDKSNHIWIGTYGGLLGKFDIRMKLIETFHPCGNDPNEMQRIVILHNLNSTNFLIGTHYRNKSLLNFNLNTGKAQAVAVDYWNDNRTNFQITSIRKNQKGETMVLIRNVGLFTFRKDKNMLSNDLPEINKRVTFKLNDFYHDKGDCYWFATQKEGLVRMSKDGLHFDKWGTEQGLPSLTLLRLESVDDKFLWISSISGLCRFDMETEQILVFNSKHNLPANEFMQRTSCVTGNGRLVFGSNAGFTIVDPKKVQANNSDTKVIISDITFQNQSIKHLNDRKYLERPLEETHFIKLPYKRNSFTLHFFSKDNNLPQFNNYAYRLKGLESNWIYLGETKHTTYTNLSPGTYTFEVKSTNKNNIWSDIPTQLTIEIIPPWYLTWYAFIAYFLFLFALIFGSMAFYTNRIKLKKEIEVSEYKVRKEHELTEKKLAFFTNISHDLKTPIALIDAPVKELLSSEGLSDIQKNKLRIIKRNAQHLYKLISDILDFRKLTQNQLPLKVCNTKIAEIVEDVRSAFAAECEKKQIAFDVQCSISEPVYVDAKKIEKILWNLLSNAIKFTPSGGEVLFKIDKKFKNEKTYLELIVKDSGIGISPNDKRKIFNRFYQKKPANKSAVKGAGIGLSIVKDLVELHHGNINVESELGKGSVFTICIPIDENEYSENEKMSNIIRQNEKPKITYVSENKPLLDIEITNHSYNQPLLLLVEDNTELREYLAGHFSRDFKVFQAGDGKEALELIRNTKPDVVISDVLMPNMNGLDFCKSIRSNFDTSHLPIILLTANSMVEQQIEGLSVGADAYVPKPFDIKFLDALIVSVLKNRKKIRDRILGAEIDDKYKSGLTSTDINFIDELKQFIQENIDNQNLNVELLARNFKLSRAQLSRKIKSLTGQTPNNLIKSVRLKAAYQLIYEKGLRVSEVAYKTGFSDPNYFTICFKKEFGENPSQIGKV